LNPFLLAILPKSATIRAMKIVQVIDLLRHQLVRLATEEDFSVHDYVLLKNDRDKIVGQVVSKSREVAGAKADNGYELVERLGEKDLERYEEMQRGEDERVAIAKQCAEDLKLSMRFFASRSDFTGNVFSFFFTSEEKVDFRDLLKVLPKKVSSRIHLQRVGTRDRAKILGGFGRCGRPTCCSTFKVELESVPLDSARDQNLLTRDNNKLFGLCGKLKCCLLYEVGLYRELRRNLPHIKQAVTVEGKSGRVMGLDILNQRVKILFDDTDIFDVFDIELVKKKFAPQKIKTVSKKENPSSPKIPDKK
jgi:cell fate regulator YaaT (PSP1 superfamily)